MTDILKSDSRLPKKIFFFLLQWKPFKNDEKCFLFHLKNYFHPPGISIFVLIFFSCRESGLISIFMASQPGYQTFTMHVLPNILRSKGHQVMEFCQLIECNKRNIFLRKIIQNLRRGD